MSDISTEDATSISTTMANDVAQKLFEYLSSSTFACGGSVEICSPGVSAAKITGATKDTPESEFSDLSSIEPVTIRWDSTSSIEKLILPLTAGDMTKELSPVAKLVAGTQPASFGFQSQDIVDETYRKASKLDASAFSTSFCPYETGIIDIIGQALVSKLSSASQGIRAELYKLNVSIYLHLHDDCS
jgi:antitoxin (DNA-binding transcriptional repressor) of toxin-antitoxin stability system